MNRRILLFALCALGVCQTVAVAEEVDLEKLLKQVEAGKAILLDVREKVEWKKFHLVDSESVPLSTVALDKTARSTIAKYTTNPDVKIYAISKTGQRSKVASDMFKRVDAEVIPVMQSYKELVAAGFKEVKGNDPYWEPPIKVLPP
ncbi:hypothetical protein GC197_03525 [bacterium]|nr:hypothetical protein [bacterium]